MEMRTQNCVSQVSLDVAARASRCFAVTISACGASCCVALSAPGSLQHEVYSEMLSPTVSPGVGLSCPLSSGSPGEWAKAELGKLLKTPSP